MQNHSKNMVIMTDIDAERVGKSERYYVQWMYFWMQSMLFYGKAVWQRNGLHILHITTFSDVFIGSSQVSNRCSNC